MARKAGKTKPTELVLVRITPSTKKALLAKCKVDGNTPSDVLRAGIRRYLNSSLALNPQDLQP